MAPRGYVQQPQPQPQYQQPYQQPYQQSYQQPYQNVAPNPAPNAGFAPRGNFQPYQAMRDMEGSQEFRDAYQKNLDAFNETNRRIKQGISKSEAVKNIKQMAEFTTQVDGSMSSERGARNAAQLLNTIEYLCLSLENPQDWLPDYRSKYIEPMRNKTAPLVAALRKTADTIKNLASTGASAKADQTPDEA